MKVSMKIFTSGLFAVIAGVASFLFSGVAAAEPHVVIVTPRGETTMEKVFMAELKRRIGPVRFTLIKPELANAAKMAALPERIAQEKPNLIYSWGTPTTVAVAGTFDKPVISDVPIVFGVVADPIRAKLVSSLARPGRNITGTSHLAPISAQLAAIAEYRPLKKLGVVYNPKEVNTKFMLEDLTVEAKNAGIELIIEEVGLTEAGAPDPATLAPKIQLVKQRGAQWLYLGPDTFVSFTNRKITTDAALEAKLPAFTANESAIRDANSLLGLFSPVENMARLIAFKASQILLNEKKVAEIPIETLQRFSVLVNMCAAKSLKNYPPLGLLNYSDVRLPSLESSDGTTPPVKTPNACTPVVQS